ncbi:MAG: GtrA-like protein [Parcubacteria group bacterium]|nr:GtrA-like protein [Parcubacteria group bacterium]
MHRALETTRRSYLARYYVMALGGVVINFGTFWILYHVFSVWYLEAAVGAFAFRFLFKFITIRTWLFLDPHAPKTFRIHSAYFLTLELSSLAVSSLLLVTLVEGLRFPPFGALVGIVAVMSAGNAVLTKTFFRPRNAT